MNRGFLRPSFLAWPTSRLFTGIYQNVPRRKSSITKTPFRGTIPAALGVRNLPPLLIFVTSVKRQVTTSRRNRFFFFFFDGKRMVIHLMILFSLLWAIEEKFCRGWLRLFVWGSSEFLMDLHNYLLLFIRYLWNRESIFKVFFFFFSCKQVCKFYVSCVIKLEHFRWIIKR